MDALKPALGDSTNAQPPPAAKPPPRPAADKPRRVVTWYDPTKLPPPRAAALLPPASPAPPAPPKKPEEAESAFVLFGRATRDDIKAAHPDWPLGEVGRELNKRWKALDDAAKKPFHDLAAADKSRYEAEKAAYEAYEAANQPAPVVVAKSAPPVPPPRKRKKPPTKEVPIDEDQDWTPKNNGKQLVNLWTGKPVEKPRDKKVDCSDDSEIEDDDSEIEDEGEPEMKKQTGYMHFCAHPQNREAAKAAVEAAQPDLSKGEKTRATTRELGAAWSALGDEAKQKWKDDAPMVAKPTKKKPAKKPATKPVTKPVTNAKAERLAAAKAEHEAAERDAPKLAELAKKEAAAQGDNTYGAARDRFLKQGLDPVAPSRGERAGVAPTKTVMLGKVDARVAAKKSKAAKGAEWLDRMTVDASFWAKVNKRCDDQAGRKKMGGTLAGGVKRGSQKGQAAAKKARKA
jgi:hypothetical protein